MNDQQCDPETVTHDFPRSFEERGLVHPDSAEAFRRFAGAMFDGKSGDTGNFVLRDPTGNWYSWVSMSYMMMYDRNGTPVKAIGIQSKLPDVSGIGPDTFPRRPLPEVLRHQLILRLKVNVSADYVEEFWNEGMDQTAWTWGRTYSEIIRLESGRLFNESEKQEFRKRFDRESLLTAYKNGEYWSSGEYRRIDRGGLIRWVADAVNLTRDERTGSVYMFACFVGCQQRREWESRIDEGIFRDPQTRLYDYVTAKRLTEYLIESGRASGCALSLIRLVGASDADSPKDMEALKNIRRFLAVAMPMALGTDCIVGHYKDDMLYVFLPDAGNRYDIKRRIEDAFAYIRISMHGIPWLDRFFSKKGDQYTISKEIRRMIIFAPHNMLSDPPFGKLDLISCRNVMIYFQPVFQRSLFGIFHSALKNGGYLFLGKSETAGEYSSVFAPVCSTEKIYMHKGEGKVDEFTPPSFNIPSVQAVSPRTFSVSDRDAGDYSMESTYVHFLESFLPACVVVNEANSVIHFFGNYTDYLAIAPGKATFNLFSMINDDLSLVASTALNRCRSEHITVTYTGIIVDCPGGRRNMDLTVSPVPGKNKEDTGLIAVLFLEHKEGIPEGITEKYDVDTTAARRIEDLEQELHESQNDLKSTIGELETVNEELQAANEELLTANEELQSSNEELQSVNEELYMVNTEYQQKLDELTMLTYDLSNFLSSTMIGILFVDSSLNIRKFTEYIGREFQLMEHDVGRSLQIFAHSFPDEDIIKDAGDVLKDLVPIDREVTAMNGRFYTLRIAPYRTTENNIRGLVITIIDSLGVKA